MRIITAPARKMKEDDSLPFTGLPVFLKETEEIKETIDALDYEGKKRVWECGDRIARENLDRFAHMNLYSALTPAILSYDGIQYAYMAPEAFDETEFEEFQPETVYRDLDEWSSLTGLAILNMIDKKYGVKVTATEIKGTTTIESIFNLIQSKK